MSKYIDADLLRNEIERLKIKACGSQAKEEEITAALSSLDLVIRFLDTLPESAKRGYKNCNGCEYNRTIKDQIGWQFRGCFGGEYKGKPIAEIELCPLKVDTLPEQPVEYPTSTEMIAEWENNELPLLRDKDFRGDAERMAYNAFMDGFAKGLGYKK